MMKFYSNFVGNQWTSKENKFRNERYSLNMMWIWRGEGLFGWLRDFGGDDIWEYSDSVEKLRESLGKDKMIEKVVLLKSSQKKREVMMELCLG